MTNSITKEERLAGARTKKTKTKPTRSTSEMIRVMLRLNHDYYTEDHDNVRGITSRGDVTKLYATEN